MNGRCPPRIRWRGFWVTTCLSLITFALTSCMVGPNFHPPVAPSVKRYTEVPLPKKTASTANVGQSGKTQTYVTGGYIPAEWWELFHSPQLNELINRGIAYNQDLTKAYATLREAQETLNAQIGNAFFPAFDAGLSGQRQRFSSASIGGASVPSTVFNLFSATVNVAYKLDVFGGARRETENLMAEVERRRFELIAAYLTITANIVTTAVNIASLQAQIEATIALLHSQEGQLNIINKQFQLGGVSRENVLSQQTLVNQTRANIPPLQKSLSQTKHALSVLIGAFPNEPLPDVRLDALRLPAQLPVSLPSHLVRQRPDVRVAEAQMHAACALVGVATANLFPQFNITGSFGWQSSVLSSLINPSTKFWSYGTQITQPIFHGGALLANRRAAIAVYEQTAAQYRQTLLQAFQNVADSLRAIETDARTLREIKRAEVSAQRNLRLTKVQYRLGGINYLNLLSAQEQYQQIVITRVQAQATRFSDTAALFQAVGGGWWNRCEGFCKGEKMSADAAKPIPPRYGAGDKCATSCS